MNMSNTPVLEQWRRELAPWLAALEGRLEVYVPPLPTPEDMANVWFSFAVDTVEDYEPAQWTVILEAFELVDLLIRVDAATGWTLLLSVVDQNPSFAINAAALFPRHYVLPRYTFARIDSDEVRDSVATVFHALRRMIAADDDDETTAPSPTFAGVKQRLLALWKQQHDDRDFDRTRDGRILIKPHMIFSSPFARQPVRSMVQRTCAMARVSRLLQPPEQRLGYIPSAEAGAEDDDSETLGRRRRDAVFCFVAIDFKLTDHPVTNEVLSHLLNVAKEALPITELVLEQVVMSQLHFTVAGSFFQSVLGVDGEPGKGLQRFDFSSGRFDRAAVGAICSALALSQTIQEFAFARSTGREVADAANDETQRPSVPRSVWWPWLAYALFSRDATNKIERVELNVHDLTVDDVEGMRRVLAHRNPLAYVCALDEPAPQRPVRSTRPIDALLRPRTRITMGHRVVNTHEQPFVDRGAATVTTNTPHQIVRNHSDEAFLEIVVPGSGVAWIDRGAVQEIRARVRRKASTVTSLELVGMTSASQPAVLELLRLVGQSLQSLRLWAPWDEPAAEDDFMETVCASCPHLTSLHVNGDLLSLRWLVTPRKRPRWKLARLALIGRVFDHASLLAFIQSLQKPDHFLSQSLHAFHFGEPSYVFRYPLAGAVLQTFCDGWSDVLRTNGRLEQCEFLLRSGHDSKTIVAFKERLRVHNGEPISTPQKIAFLSVLVAPHRPASERKRHKAVAQADAVSARVRLPREAARLILDMASIPSRRICGCPNVGGW